MKLDGFFDAVAPVLLGTVPPAEAARTLYAGEPGREVDAGRLAIYARFCRTHRYSLIEDLYPHCRTVVERERGRNVWEQLVDAYFLRHPMHHVELNANGADWPAFLSIEPPVPALAPWLPALADLEWWEWQTIIAADPPAGEDARTGPLRFAPTLELRQYGYDLVDWIDDGIEGAPEETPTFVLFWRDSEFSMRRENAGPIEMMVLKSLAEGAALTPALLKSLGVERALVDETIEDLRAAEILHGV